MSIIPIKYEAFFEYSNDLMGIFDFQGNYLKVNPSFLSSLGFTEEEVVGRSIFNFQVVEDVEKSRKSFQEFIQPPHHFEEFVNRLKSKNGETKWFAWHTATIVEGKYIYFIGRDITERKKTIFDLEENAQMIHQILDLVPHAIFIKNSRRQYVLVNAAQLKLYGHEKETLLGTDDSRLHTNAEELRTIWDSDSLVLEHRESVMLENQLITLKDGTQKYLSTQKIPFINRDGTVNILGVSIDITELKKASQDLIQANFELDNFVYRASHDLRAPLRSILGLVNVAFLKPDKPNLLDCMTMIKENVSKLDNFITDLTEYSRNNRVSLEIVKIDWEALLNETYANLKYMDGADLIQIQIRDLSKGDFYSDNKRLSVIFSNLISNAIKYSKKNNEDSLLIEITGNANKAIALKFVDNGIGIESGHLNRIFDMFYRASENSFGSGLGLYIVKQIVEKLHGSIQVTSEYGEGTVFSMLLPNLTNNKRGLKH